MTSNNLDIPKTTAVLAGLMTSGVFGPLAALGAIGLALYGIGKLFSGEEDDTDELDTVEQKALKALSPSVRLESHESQESREVTPYKALLEQPLNQPHEYSTPTVQSTVSPTVETTVKPIILEGVQGTAEHQEPPPEDKQELIRKAMSELGKKSAEARRRKKAGIEAIETSRP